MFSPFGIFDSRIGRTLSNPTVQLLGAASESRFCSSSFNCRILKPRRAPV